MENEPIIKQAFGMLRGRTISKAEFLEDPERGTTWLRIELGDHESLEVHPINGVAQESPAKLSIYYSWNAR